MDFLLNGKWSNYTNSNFLTQVALTQLGNDQISVNEQFMSIGTIVSNGWSEKELTKPLLKWLKGINADDIAKNDPDFIIFIFYQIAKVAARHDNQGLVKLIIEYSKQCIGHLQNSSSFELFIETCLTLAVRKGKELKFARELVKIFIEVSSNNDKAKKDFSETLISISKYLDIPASQELWKGVAILRASY